MTSDWRSLEQGLIGKKVVGLERTIPMVPGQNEKDAVNGLIMDIFNIFIARKLTFEKKDMAPMKVQVTFRPKDLLFTYVIDGGRLLLLALAERNKKELVSVRLVLTPAEVAMGDPGENIKTMLGGLHDPYRRRP